MTLTLGTGFIFDPKMGMPRDWDLFAFSLIPTIVWFYVTVLSTKALRKDATRIALLGISLCLLTLIPRAQSIADPNAAIPRFRDYLDIDETKGRNAWLLLVNYLENIGDSANVAATMREWKSRFPEELMIARANDMYSKEGNLPGTVRLLRTILNINPTYSDAYDFLGVCYIDLRKYDSAIANIRIADGLSPLRATTLANLGRAYHLNGELSLSESALAQSLTLDTINFAIYYNMAQLQKDLGNQDAYCSYLEASTLKPGAPIIIVRELVVARIMRGEVDEAVQAFLRAPQLVNDTAFMRQTRTHIPNWDSLIAIR